MKESTSKTKSSLGRTKLDCDQGPRRSFKPGDPAFALVSTLLIIAVLTIMVVAFMQSMRIDRLTARSYLEKYRADLAVESGRNAAEAALNRLTTNDSYIVVGSGAYTYIGSTTNAGSNSVSYIPLFSHNTNTTNLLSVTNFSLTNLPSVTPSGKTILLKPFADTARTVNVSLVNMLDGNSNVVGRFAYWIEDLSGKVNGTYAGNIQDAGKHSRPSGTNINEVALYRLFSTNNSDTNSALIISNRTAMISPRTYLEVISAPSVEIQDSLTFSTKQTSELEVIPHGFGYVDQGKQKYNLNYYVANRDVDGLAAIISSNMTNFSSRKGGLPDDYNKTIAANIIGYASTNSTPLVGTNYRGVSSTPFVTVLHDKNVLNSITKEGANFYANVVSRVFVQLWNPSSRNITGSFKLEFENNDDLIVGVNNPTMADPGSIVSGYPFPPKDITMKPNEVTVVEFGPITYKFDGGTTEMSTTNSISRNSPNHVRTTFRSYWNSVIVDRSLGGMERRNGSLAPGTTKYKVTGGLPGLRLFGSDDYNTVYQSHQHPMGDPRATYYLKPQIAQTSYENRTSWWGMAIMRPSSSGSAPPYYTDSTKWTDASPNTSAPYPATNSTTDLNLNLSTSLLATYKSNIPAASIANTNEAPSYFSTNNAYVSATELGNVYDPGQWHWATSYPSGPIPTAATNNVNFGGGISFRIGRSEHPKFDVAGQRAYQLLDLFDVDLSSTNAGVRPKMVSGKINLNTASTNVLTTLMSGIKLEKDVASGTKNVSSEVVTAFVNAVVDKRAKQPFLATSELAGLTNANGTIFGNPKQWDNTNTVPATFKDVALEEMFAKVYDLSTVRSRIFRAVVVGQALDKSGKPTASTRKEFYIALEPVRDPATGVITSQNCSIFYEKDL